MDHDHALKLFGCSHLPPHLAQISAHFRDLALVLLRDLPPSAERTLALRALWEAKNNGVMAKVIEHDTQQARGREQARLAAEHNSEPPLPMEGVLASGDPWQNG